MRQHVFGRACGWRRLAVVTAVPVFCAVAMLGTASSASASLRGDLQRFANCPFNNPTVVKCVYSTTTGGEFVLGKAAVPVTQTLTIQGGLGPHAVVVPATNGETVSKTPLKVPGGLLGLEIFGNLTEVTATAELAGQAEILTSVHLPLQVRLGNPVLGPNCVIGSEAEPVDLHLTYGTTNPPPPNKPISGELKTSSRDNSAIVSLEGKLVDNSFAAPGANGCTILPFLGDAIVNLKEGLPAAAGSNTAILIGANEEAAAGQVRNTLPLPELGRCVKVEGKPEGKKLVFNGEWSNSSCTEEAFEKTGKFEFIPGPGPKAGFTAKGTSLTLATASGAGVTCSSSSGTGSYTGAKTVSTTLTLSGCHIGPKSKPTPCASSGAGAGEVKTAALTGGVDFIKEGLVPETPIVGLDLKAASGSTVAAFSCGGSSFTVEGSVIAPFGVVDHMTTSLKAKAAATAGAQSPEAFEEGPKDVLSFVPSGGSAEQAGLTTTLSATGEEAVEIKAIG